MKRTITVNLDQRVYTIDDDAYKMLDEYLSTLRQVFAGNDSTDEIIDDIEVRISELFAEKITDLHRVITISDVNEVIARIGRPEDFSIDEESDTSGQRANIPPIPDTVRPTPRRLYRDPANKMVGGVCSGIARYINVDPVWVRLFVILLFCCFHVITVAAYLVLWAIVPEANTAGARMSMSGASPTLDNVAKVVSEQYNNARDYIQSPSSRSFLSRLGRGITSVCAVLFKIILVPLAVIAVPLVVAAGLWICCALVGIVQEQFGYESWLFTVFSPIGWGAHLIGWGSCLYQLFTCGIAVIVGIPALALLWIIWNALFSSGRAMSRSTGKVMFAVWLVGITVAVICATIINVHF